MSNYNQMTSKKLNVLKANMSTDSAEYAEINAILEARANTAATAETEVSTDEQAFIDGLNNPANENAADENATDKKFKMTFEECSELADSLKHQINSKCQVVPFNTIEWVDGVIAGIIADKRVHKVLYAIRCDDGRRIVKAYDSKLLRISEEKAETQPRTRTTKSPKADMSLEQLMELANSHVQHLGKIIEFAPTREIYTLDANTNAPVPVTKLRGTIVGIVPDKRSSRILYRVSAIYNRYDELTETNVASELIIHKVAGSDSITFTGEVDNIYVEKASEKRFGIKADLTLAEQFEAIKKAVEKAEVNVANAQSTLARKQELYNEIYKAYEAELNAEIATPAVETADENAE